MRAQSILLAAFFTLSSVLCARAGEADPGNSNNPDLESAFNRLDAESEADILRHNDSVTDAEIEAWHEYMLQHNEAELLGWRNQLPSERSEFVAKERRAHNEAKRRLDTLRTMSAKERAEMDSTLAIFGPHIAKISPARELMASLDSTAHREVLEAGIELVLSRLEPGTVDSRGIQNLKQSQIPRRLDFLAPQLVRCLDDVCFIYLHKGIGAGMGYQVEFVEDRGWLLYSFDHYRGWDRTEIELESKR